MKLPDPINMNSFARFYSMLCISIMMELPDPIKMILLCHILSNFGLALYLHLDGTARSHQDICTLPDCVDT